MSKNVRINETFGSPLAAIQAALKKPGNGGYSADAFALVVLNHMMDVSHIGCEVDFWEACQRIASDCNLIVYDIGDYTEGGLGHNYVPLYCAESKEDDRG